MSASALLSINSPFTTQITGQKRVIKGFASVELPDRDRQISYSDSFELDTFANCPQMLVNHDFINEPDGSDSAAGLITHATASYIKNEDPTNSEQWVIHSISTDEFVAVYPKSKTPKMTIGDRGLFVVGEVTHPKAIAKVDSGELSSFSWRGYSSLEVDSNGIGHLKSIDLVEISIVNIPCQNQSNFTVVDENNPGFNKEISIKELVPYKKRFSKTNYSIDQINEYIKKYHPTKQISETEDNYYIQLTDASDVDQDSAFMFTKNLVAAPMKMKNIVTKFNDSQENKMSQDQTVASTESRQSVPVRYGMVNIDALKMLVPSLKVQENIKNFTVEEENATLDVSVDLLEIPQEAVNEAIEQSLAVDTTPVVEDSIEEDSTETVSETEVTEPVQEETPVEDAKDTKIAELESKLEVLIQGMNTMVQNQAKEAEQKAAALEAVKQAKIEAEKQQAAKSAQEFEQLKSALFNSIPQQPVREEKVDSAKSFQTQNTQLSNEVLGDAAMAYFFNKNIDAKGAF